MSKIFALLSLLLIANISVQAQSYEHHIPDDLHIASGWGNDKLLVESDFNKDGNQDYFMILANKEGGLFFLSLISKGKHLLQNALIPLQGDFYCCSSLEVKPKNVIQLSSQGNRYFQQYKIRWDDKMSQFRIIGFDDHDLPSHTGDSYSNSFNFYTRKLISIKGHNDFATGKYKAKEKVRNFKGIKKYYLKDINDCIQVVEHTILR